MDEEWKKTVEEQTEVFLQVRKYHDISSSLFSAQIYSKPFLEETEMNQPLSTCIWWCVAAALECSGS